MARWDPGGRGDLEGEGAQLSPGRVPHTGAPPKCQGRGVGKGGGDTHSPIGPMGPGGPVGPTMPPMASVKVLERSGSPEGEHGC